MRAQVRLFRLAAAAAFASSAGLSLLLLPGCGSGGYQSLPVDVPVVSQKLSGRALFSVRWPKRDNSRLVPVAAESIRIVLRRADATLAERVLPRPAQGGVSEAVFTDLPLGDLIATATAYPNADGTGTAQASAAVPVAVRAGENAPLRLTMASTITDVNVMPLAASLEVGGTGQQFVAAAKDAVGNVVLTRLQGITWVSEDNSVVSVDGNGFASARTEGSARVTATETESGKSGSAQVTVTDPGPAGARIAARYSVTPLIMPGTTTLYPESMNERTEIVGISLAGGFLWRNGAATALPAVAGHNSTAANDINDAGDIVGASSQGGQITTIRAVVWPTGGTPQLLAGTAGYQSSTACAITSVGEVAGFSRYYGGTGTPQHTGFVWRPGSPATSTEISSPRLNDYHGPIRMRLNDSGQVISTREGNSGDTTKIRAFVWSQGVSTDLPLPAGHSASRGMSINSRGTAVGSIGVNFAAAAWQGAEFTLSLLPATSSGVPFQLAYDVNDYDTIVGNGAATGVGGRAIIHARGVSVDLNDRLSPDSGWVLRFATAINNKGEIAGYGTYNGITRGFLLTPQTP